MSPSTRRILIPLIVGGIALAVVIVGITSGPPGTPAGEGEVDTPAGEVVAGETVAESAGEDAAAPNSDGEATTTDDPEAAEDGRDPATREPAPAAIVRDGLRAVAPDTGTRGHDDNLRESTHRRLGRATSRAS